MLALQAVLFADLVCFYTKFLGVLLKRYFAKLNVLFLKLK